MAPWHHSISSTELDDARRRSTLRYTVGLACALCLLVVLSARSPSQNLSLRKIDKTHTPGFGIHEMNAASVVKPALCEMPSLDKLKKICPFLLLKPNATSAHTKHHHLKAAKPRDNLMRCWMLLEQNHPCSREIAQPAVEHAVADIPQDPNAESLSLLAQVFRIQQSKPKKAPAKHSLVEADDHESTLLKRDWQQFPEAKLGLPSTAVCFTGGSSRALTAAVGQLRALMALDVLDDRHVGYLSGVSGGSWATSVFTFYRSGANTDEELLGKATYGDLKDLNMAKLSQKPSPLASVATTNFLAVGLQNIFTTPANELWASVVHEAVLAPFGIPSDSLLAQSADDVSNIIKRNPSLAKKPFAVPRAKRPFWVAHGAIDGPTWSDGTHSVSLQFTPWYTGSPFLANDTGLITYSAFLQPSQDILVGGGVVSSFAFGAKAPKSATDQHGVDASEISASKKENLVTLEMPHKLLTLARAVSISSDAPGRLFHNLLGFSNLNPTNLLWPVTPPETKTVEPAREFAFSDGGTLDDLGLLAMLQRGVRRVVVFINTGERLPTPTQYDACDSKEPPTAKEWDSTELSPLFGINGNALAYGADYWHNAIFAKSELTVVLCALQRALAEGRPAVAAVRHRVLANKWWGIRGGWEVEVLWNYLAHSPSFHTALPDDVQKELEKGPTGKFKNFPSIDTFGVNGDLVQLTNEQVNLMGAFSEWAVMETAREIKTFLAPRT